jgi:hypothetical protein
MQFVVNGQQMGPQVRPSMDVSETSTKRRDESIVPASEWSLDDLKLLQPSALMDCVVETLLRGLRPGQVERVGKSSLVVKPLMRPNPLKIRAVSRGFTVALVLSQDGA